jgi:DNA mismatch endonuclease (patch repair protein)
MVDIVSEAVRSRMMAAIGGADTKPEMAVRRFLHGQGFRYRLHVRSLPGSPDLVLAKYRLAIFVHGCFWHRHAGCRFATVPDKNFEKWQCKFNQNVRRDGRALEELSAMGWRVMVIWECAVRTASLRSTLTSLPALIADMEASIIEWPLLPGSPRPESTPQPAPSRPNGVC